MANKPLSPQSFRRLVKLNRELALVLLEANRDPVTGVFKPGSSITAPALRKAWGLAAPSNASRELFKAKLIEAIRAKQK